MDIIHKSSHYIAKQSSTQIAIGQSNSFGDSPNMDCTAMVPYAAGNVDRLSSYAASIEEDSLPSIQPGSRPSTV